MRALVVALALAAGCGTGGPGATQTAPPTNSPAASAVATPTPAVTTGTSASLPPGVLAGGSGWGAALEATAQAGELYLFACPPDGTASTVWGTDTYTGDSSVCTAAVHAGLIDFATGGSPLVEVLPGLAAYVGSTRNGVTSSDYPSWGTSFAFVDAPRPTASPGTGATSSPAAGEGAYAELLSHIPAAISGSCTAVDPTAAGALAVARCEPEDLVGPSGDVTYIRYASDDPLFDLLDEKLDEVGEVPTSSDPQACAAGPILTAYHAAGFVEGRLICAADTRYGGELIAWWFDYRFNAVGSILLFEGSYQDLYDDVLAAELEP